jgi:oligopeptide/dipeptide ABC transporter ATP-binding protein
MYSGSIVEVAGAARLFRNAQHPYAQALLDAVPVLRDDQTALRPIPGTMPALTDPPAGCRFHPRCPSALAACAAVVPHPVTTEPGHSVSCHLYQGSTA